jgi:transposase
MDGDQTPLAAIITPANEHEVRHIERLVESAIVELPKPSRLLYDKAADSDTLRDRLAANGIELICPHRSNRIKPKRQDGRKLRRAKNSRWRIERTNSWLHNYGRFSVRKDRLGIMFLGWTQLACLYIILKRF